MILSRMETRRLRVHRHNDGVIFVGWVGLVVLKNDRRLALMVVVYVRYERPPGGIINAQGYHNLACSQHDKQKVMRLLHFHVTEHNIT